MLDAMLLETTEEEKFRSALLQNFMLVGKSGVRLKKPRPGTLWPMGICVGTMAENKWHEQECVDAILLSQEGYVCRDHPGDNKIKLVRPLTLIPECMPENHAMERCMSLLEACDAIILCDDWQFSKGCLEEEETAESWGMEVLYYSEVIK